MKIEKVERLVANLHDKTEHVTLIRNLKQALNHGLVLTKLHRIIEFKQKTYLKFFKLMSKEVFGKTMANVRKHRNINVVTTERRRNYLVSEANYHITVFHIKFVGYRN